MKYAIAALLVLSLGSARAAHAHDVRGEVMFLDIGEHAIDVEIHVAPLQLSLARKSPALGPGPDPTGPLADEILATYATRRIGARTRDGRDFTTTITSIAESADHGHDVVVIRARLRAPDGADARWFEIHDDLILDSVVTATVYVFVRTDVQTGVLDRPPTLAGYLHYQQRTLTIDRTTGSLWQAFTTTFTLGITHIRDGADHLLFLLLLLLPAPLLARSGRWRQRRSATACWRANAAIVTAFTVGHSISLILSTLYGALAPSSVIETLVAASVLLTAAHALRPIFPRNESVIAALFGLIHGLALATALHGIVGDGASLTVALLGFNLGVEAMQLVVLAATLPWLHLLARHHAHSHLRVGAGILGLIASSAWIAQRASLIDTPIPTWIDHAAANAPWLLAALVAVTLAIELRRRLAAPRSSTCAAPS